VFREGRQLPFWQIAANQNTAFLREILALGATSRKSRPPTPAKAVLPAVPKLLEYHPPEPSIEVDEAMSFI